MYYQTQAVFGSGRLLLRGFPFLVLGDGLQGAKADGRR